MNCSRSLSPCGARWGKVRPGSPNGFKVRFPPDSGFACSKRHWAASGFYRCKGYAWPKTHELRLHLLTRNLILSAERKLRGSLVRQRKRHEPIAMNNEFPILSGGSGAAFLLDAPAQVSSALSFPDGLVTIRQDAPFATVSLVTPLNQEDAKNDAWRVLQEALDVLAARRQTILQTAEGDCTYLVWVKDGAGYELVFVDTADEPWSMSIGIKVEGAGTAVPTPSSPPLPRHPALRFYRLAHASADLFDAFRNAYLALECLVSETTPKGPNESELNWLKRALAGPLSSGLPSGLIGPGTVEEIYRDGRLPTFHAKVGSAFYAPNGPERQSMQVRFDTLALLVNCLLQHRFGHAFVSRSASMSQAVYDSMALTTLTYDEIAFRDGELRASAHAAGQVVSSPRRFNQLWGRTTVARPASLQWIDAIETRKAGVDWTSSILEECVPLQGENKISVELNLLQYNSRSKRPVHRR